MIKTYMFPGQGSQAKEMGASLFDSYPELTAQADDILGYSIRQLCMEDPHDQLNSTQFTQPALFVVNALSYYRKVEEAGLPDFLVGHSLGEFNALHAAGCFDFEAGLRMVQKRGELMAQVSNGAMAAVLNATKEEIEERLKSNGLDQLYLANYNTPTQIVISGLFEQIAAAEQFFKDGKMRYYPLATSGAFHSAFMRDAMARFREHLNNVTFADPVIAVIANVTARPYRHETMLDTLSSQIASTVRWSESIQYLLALAAHRGDSVQFDELGHGDVLARLVMTIKVQTPEPLLQKLGAEEFGEAPSRGAAGAVGGPAAPVALNAAEQKVIAWNRKYPIGTKGKSSARDYDELETRSEAVVLFGHRAAVYMKGYNGYFDLDELTPA